MLDHVDIEIAPGEVVALLGSSGSGESTLLRIVAGLDRPTDGRIEIDGNAVRGIDPRCAVVFQEPRLLPWRSLAANVAFGLPPGTARSKGAAAVQHAQNGEGIRREGVCTGAPSGNRGALTQFLHTRHLLASRFLPSNIAG